MPAHGVGHQVRRFADAQQEAQESGIDEIRLGRLEKALAEVRVVRLQQEDDSRRFQDPQPPLHGWNGHPHLHGQGRHVQKTARLRGQKSQKEGEPREVRHLRKAPDIPLHVGSDVVVEPPVRGQSLVVDAGIEPLVEDLRRGRRRLVPFADAAYALPRIPSDKARQFRPSQGEQFEVRHPTGEALPDAFHQEELLASGQDEVLAAPVHVFLEVAEEPGYPLDLVQDGAVAEIVEESARIGFGPRTPIQRFQAHIGVLGEHQAGKRGLSALTRSHQGDAGVSRRQLRDELLQNPRMHRVNIISNIIITQVYFREMGSVSQGFSTYSISTS